MPFAWLMLLLLLLVAAPLLVGRAFQQRAPAAAPKAWQAVGCAVDRDLHHRSAHRWEVQNARSIKSIGTDGIVAIMALTLCAWAVGWLLGGPEISNRKVLAISTSMRNVGVCFLIAAHSFPGTDVVVPILAFSGISIPLNMLFALITGRLLRDTEERARPALQPRTPETLR